MQQETRKHPTYDPDRTVQSQVVAREVYEMPPSPPKRKRRLGCLLRGLLAALILLPITCGGLFAAYQIVPPPRLNVLVLGLDARPGEGNTTRTDVMMLVTVDPKQPYVGMLSIPRDLYVDIPGSGMQRINAAHVIGEQRGDGRQLAAQTVANTLGVPVHRTVRLNFEAFIAVVDAAGGVQIDVPSYIVDYEYPTMDYGVTTIEFQPGPQQMDGERALQYARTRHSSSDFDRAERQQQVLEALFRKLANPLNWHRLPAVYAAVNQHVDTDLTALDALALGPAVVMSGSVEHEVLDGDYVTGFTTSQGASVLRPDMARITPLVDRMFRR